MTKTPTQEEKDRALKMAAGYVDPGSPGRIVDIVAALKNLSRCHLHATAELARAEERIRRLERQHAKACETLAALDTTCLRTADALLVETTIAELARGEED